jgi:hypothetical protein
MKLGFGRRRVLHFVDEIGKNEYRAMHFHSGFDAPLRLRLVDE